MYRPGSASKSGGARILPSKGGKWPAPTQEMPAVEYLIETLIPVVFYTAVLLFLFSNLTEA